MATARGTLDVTIEAALTVTIVPDSGTLEIDNDGGKHSYVLQYEHR